MKQLACLLFGIFLQLSVLQAQSMQVHEVYFGFDSATLTYKAKKEIKTFLDSLPGRILNIELFGYTDATGNPTYNLRLSNRRVNSVRTFLSNYVELPDEAITKAFGQDNAKAPNTTARNRALNRRVEILVFLHGKQTEQGFVAYQDVPDEWVRRISPGEEDPDPGEADPEIQDFGDNADDNEDEDFALDPNDGADDNSRDRNNSGNKEATQNSKSGKEKAGRDSDRNGKDKTGRDRNGKDRNSKDGNGRDGNGRDRNGRDGNGRDKQNGKEPVVNTDPIDYQLPTTRWDSLEDGDTILYLGGCSQVLIPSGTFAPLKNGQLNFEVEVINTPKQLETYNIQMRDYRGTPLRSAVMIKIAALFNGQTIPAKKNISVRMVREREAPDMPLFRTEENMDGELVWRMLMGQNSVGDSSTSYTRLENGAMEAETCYYYDFVFPPGVNNFLQSALPHSGCTNWLDEFPFWQNGAPIPGPDYVMANSQLALKVPEAMFTLPQSDLKFDLQYDTSTCKLLESEFGTANYMQQTGRYGAIGILNLEVMDPLGRPQSISRKRKPKGQNRMTLYIAKVNHLRYGNPTCMSAILIPGRQDRDGKITWDTTAIHEDTLAAASNSWHTFRIPRTGPYKLCLKWQVPHVVKVKVPGGKTVALHGGNLDSRYVHTTLRKRKGPKVLPLVLPKAGSLNYVVAKQARKKKAPTAIAARIQEMKYKKRKGFYKFKGKQKKKTLLNGDRLETCQ